MIISAEKLYELCYKFSIAATKKKPEAPKYGPFGEFAWASHREGMPEEPDTAIEKEIYDQLKKHFLTYNRKGLPEITSLFLSILMELGWYKEVIHEPIQNTLYRGLKLKNKSELSKILGMSEKEIDEEGAKNFKEKTTIECKNGFSTSWTVKKSITSDYAEKDKTGKEAKRGFGVILIADIKDNKNKFIAGPGGLYDVEGLSMYHLEKEVVGLEPINIKRIEWYEL